MVAEVWAIEGVDMPGAALRALAHAATGGAWGVVEPGDLKVAPTTPTGKAVQVLAGAGLVLNPAAPGQTYMIHSTSAVTTDPVPDVGSGGERLDVVYATVLDPEYNGSTAGVQFSVDVGVAGPYADLVRELRYGRVNWFVPRIPLAVIRRPASSGTIEASHITDVRRVALPRQHHEICTFQLTAAMGVQTLTSTAADGQTWPPQLDAGGVPVWQVNFPTWANRVQVISTINGVKFPAGNTWGEVWTQLGSNADPRGCLKSQTTEFDSPGATTEMAMPIRNADNIFIPEWMRGLRHGVYPRGKITGGATGARPFLNWNSSLDVTLNFYNAADW